MILLTYWRYDVFNQFKHFLSVTTLILTLFSSQAMAEKAPEFSLKGDNGKITLSDYRGKVVYVDFWASWCKPCRKSFPFMNEMEKKYANRGLKIIAINLDSDISAAKTFLKKNKADFTVAYDPDGVTPGKYQVRVMPTSYLIDKNGNIQNIHKGFKEDQRKELEAQITKQLNK